MSRELRRENTPAQEETLDRIHDMHTATPNGWYRARSNGERVVLANLYRKGELARRTWRKGRISADDAHEYRLAYLTPRQATCHDCGHEPHKGRACSIAIDNRLCGCGGEG